MHITKQDITVFVVDDENYDRDSLTLLLESKGFQVNSYDSAIEFLKYFDPDLPGCLVLDMCMPLMNGLELQKELKKINSDIPIIFLSGSADIPISSKAFRAGAVDFIEKSFDQDALISRIAEVVEDLRVTWPEIQEKRQILSKFAQLTPREKEVFTLIIHNHSSKETARKLGISNRTIDIHRSHIMKKMQADSLNSLVIMAVTAEMH